MAGHDTFGWPLFAILARPACCAASICRRVEVSTGAEVRWRRFDADKVFGHLGADLLAVGAVGGGLHHAAAPEVGKGAALGPAEHLLADGREVRGKLVRRVGPRRPWPAVFRATLDPTAGAKDRSIGEKLKAELLHVAPQDALRAPCGRGNGWATSALIHHEQGSCVVPVHLWAG